MVRDRTYEASTANTTAIASGRNSAAAGPLKKNIGTNTIEMEIVETNAGVAICAAPSMIACRISFPSSMLRLMFSIVTVAIENIDRKSTRLNSSHLGISYAVFCVKKKESQAPHDHSACLHQLHQCDGSQRRRH